MVDWAEVELTALRLPGTALGEAHEGSPAVFVHRAQFARRRQDDQGAILQFWVADGDLVNAYCDMDPGTYWAVPGYSRKVVMARLDRLDSATLEEILGESWSCRAPTSLRRHHRR